MRGGIAAGVGVLIALAATLFAGGAVLAQDSYPTRFVRLVVPFPAGGGGSYLARLIEPKIAKSLGQPIVIDSKPGANGLIGTNYVVTSPADGYTLLLHANTIVIDQSLKPNGGYNVKRDLIEIANIARSPYYIVVRSDVPVHSISELVDYVKQNPDKLLYGHSGVGGPNHLAIEQFKKAANIEIRGIPYRGVAPTVTALLAGDVQLTFDFAQNWKAHAEAGTVRILAIAGSKRDPTLPDVPTLAEAGFPGYESGSWIGLFARRGTPDAVLDKLNKAVAEAVREPDVVEQLAKVGYTPIGSTRAEFSALIDSELEKFAAIIAQTGIKIE